MARIVTIDQMDTAINEILSEYDEMTIHTVREVTNKIGVQAVKLLKSNSGIFGGTGKYAKGWTKTSEGGRFDTTVTIHNKLAGMPHLLEHGHALRNGGRTAARVHIAPVEKELITKYENQLRAEL